MGAWITEPTRNKECGELPRRQQRIMGRLFSIYIIYWPHNRIPTVRNGSSRRMVPLKQRWRYFANLKEEPCKGWSRTDAQLNDCLISLDASLARETELVQADLLNSKDLINKFLEHRFIGSRFFYFYEEMIHKEEDRTGSGELNSTLNQSARRT